MAQLDLADLGSVHAFADRFVATSATLDILLNNAGVMAVPQRMQTVDGYELQFATNYLGPFALTNRLLPTLLATRGARVTTMSSGLAAQGRMRSATSRPPANTPPTGRMRSRSSPISCSPVTLPCSRLGTGGRS